MKYKIEIENIEIVDEIENYWTNDDYVALLEKFDYPDGSNADKDSLKEFQEKHTKQDKYIKGLHEKLSFLENIGLVVFI